MTAWHTMSARDLAASTAEMSLDAPARAAWDDADAGTRADLEFIRGRAAAATRFVVLAAVAAAMPLALVDAYLALLPAAFVLGWLNLVGL